MFYSGIDQHKRDSFITTYDDGGAIVKQERVPNTPLRIQRYFAQFPDNTVTGGYQNQRTSEWGILPGRVAPGGSSGSEPPSCGALGRRWLV